MKRRIWMGLSLGIISAAAMAVWAGGEQVLYQKSFEKDPAGQVPDDFLVLDGQFTVKQEGTNKFLELPGAPLDTFGALFGPTLKEDDAVSARILGEKKGRRFPVFGVGLNGWGGYRLQVAPAKKALELLKGDSLKASALFEWEPGKWTFLKLEVRKAKDGGWKVEGSAWTEGKTAPSRWMISWDEKEEPKPGRASIMGSPYSGMPIRYDGLEVREEHF